MGQPICVGHETLPVIVPLQVTLDMAQTSITLREVIIYVITFFLPPLGVFMAQVRVV